MRMEIQLENRVASLFIHSIITACCMHLYVSSFNVVFEYWRAPGGRISWWRHVRCTLASTRPLVLLFSKMSALAALALSSFIAVIFLFFLNWKVPFNDKTVDPSRPAGMASSFLSPSPPCHQGCKNQSGPSWLKRHKVLKPAGRELLTRSILCCIACLCA